MLIAYADGTLFHGDRDGTSLARVDTGLELCGAVFLPDGDGFVLAAGTRIYGFSPSSASWCRASTPTPAA